MNIAQITVLITIGFVSLYYLFPVAQVEGNSMEPTLQQNDIMICCRVPILLRKYKTGQIYLIQKSPSDALIVKRLVQHIPSKKVIYILGDNPSESYDSRYYGYIKAETIIAKVLWHSKHQIKKEVTHQ